MTFQPAQFILPLLAGASLVLLVVAHFTRPNPRRLVGALVGGFAFGALNVLWDIAGKQAGWWYYPWTDAPFAPLPLYLVQALSYGAAVSCLIGWRINRRFGTRGIVGFFVLFPIWGGIHDFLGTAAISGTVSNTIIFGPGPVPVFADGLCYETMAMVGQLVMRLIAGPASADRLGRWPAPHLASLMRRREQGVTE